MDDVPVRNRRPAKMVWIGLGLFLCGLLVGLVFGLGYVFADSEVMTLKEFLRQNFAAALVSLAFVVFGLATTAAGLVNRGGPG